MKITRSLGLALFGIGAVSCAAVFAQPQQPPDKRNSQPEVPGDVVPYLGQNGFRVEFFDRQQESARLAQQYIKAEKEDEKKQIRSKLANVLAKQFDAQVARQEKDLADLEKQIASLKALLKKRTDAKTAIIDHRTEQLIRDAQGLGWSVPGTGNWATPGNHAGNPFSPLYGPVEDKKP